MAAIINTNIQSLNAQRNLSSSQSSLATSMQRLSSGLRINSAKDDAAGLAISERMSTQVRGLTVAARNANDGISLAQTAEGALSSVGNNLQRIRELAVQARNATNSAEDRAALNAEVQQLKDEVTRIAQQTTFNGTKLLDGSFTDMAFQVGANQGDTINISGIANANISALGSWNSAVTNASVMGVVPDGGAAKSVSTTESGEFTTATATAAGEKFTLMVGTVSLLDKTSAAGDLSVTAADIDTALTTKKTELEEAGITFTGTAAGDDLVFTKAGESKLTIALTSNFTTAGGFATTGFVGEHDTVVATEASFPELKDDMFTLQGVKSDGKQGDIVNINVGAAGSASDRITALIHAVNAQTHNTGVTASMINGKMSLESKYGDFNVGSSLGDAGLEDAIGLKMGKSGVQDDDTPYAKGTAKTGFADLDISTTGGADDAILAMDAALMSVNGARASLGAVQSRFETTVENLNVTTENLSASRSRIMDADFAVETANLSRSQILQQAGTAMVAQANQLPQQVLQLLQG